MYFGCWLSLAFRLAAEGWLSFAFRLAAEGCLSFAFRLGWLSFAFLPLAAEG
jgi:hypothetical protein